MPLFFFFSFFFPFPFSGTASRGAGRNVRDPRKIGVVAFWLRSAKLTHNLWLPHFKHRFDDHGADRRTALQRQREQQRATAALERSARQYRERVDAVLRGQHLITLEQAVELAGTCVPAVLWSS